MSKIEWTEKTWNPSIGCNKVSQGCKNCYAEVMARRLRAMGNKDYKDEFEFKVLEHRLEHPIKRKTSTVFFVNSMSDLFHEQMPYSFLDKVFDVMRRTRQHTYQILTKRAENLSDYCKGRQIQSNIFLGVTVENRLALKRMEILKQLKCNKFLSIEPLLEDLGDNLDFRGIHWIIVGGESGPKARIMKKQWIERIRSACLTQGIPFFFKQWGAYGEDEVKRNKKSNGRLLDNKEYNQIPSLLRHRRCEV